MGILHMTAATVYQVKTKIHALASQVYVLATGLQNAAPPGTSGKSIQYLVEAAAELERVSETLQALLPEGEQQAKSTLGRREL